MRFTKQQREAACMKVGEILLGATKPLLIKYIAWLHLQAGYPVIGSRWIESYFELRRIRGEMKLEESKRLNEAAKECWEEARKTQVPWKATRAQAQARQYEKRSDKLWKEGMDEAYPVHSKLLDELLPNAAPQANEETPSDDGEEFLGHDD